MSASLTTILFFDHTAKMGGGEISLFNIVTNLDHDRFEPIVVLASDGVLRERLSAVGIETHVLPLSSEVAGVRKDSLTGAGVVAPHQAWEIARYIWRLRGFARRRGVDILHTNSLKADLIGAVAGRLAGLPVIWHVRDRIADDYLPPSAARAFRLLCRVLPNYIVVNSASTLESLQLPTHLRGRVIYNSIVHDGLPFQQPLEDDEPLPAPHEDLEDLLAAPTPDSLAAQNGNAQAETAPVIGLVGRISPWKGQDIFLLAAAQVKQRYPRARFQIIGAPLFGEEDYEAEMRALCSQLGLDENVEWLGFREDVPELIERLTILAHASKTGEPFGQVVVEAMMAKRPLVATNGGGVPEIVISEQTGLLVPMNDAPAMAQALLRLLDAPDWAGELGRAGYRRAIENFTIGHTVGKIHRLYDDVLRNRRTFKLYQALIIVGALLALLGWHKRRSGGGNPATP